jgi:NTE family protein
MDQLHTDLEHIKLFNERPGVRHIDTLVINPTEDVSEIARRHRNELPASLRVLLRTLGANNSAGTQLLSYLLFERGYTRELIALGQRDARARANEIRAFLALEYAPRYRAATAS